MHSKLFCNEEGRVELNGLRSCRQKVATSFELPSAPVERAQLFIQASKDEPEAAPLLVQVGEEKYSVEAPAAQQPRWLRCALEPSILTSGENKIEIPAQPGWSIASDTTSNSPVIRLRVDGDGADEVLWPHYGDRAIEEQRDAWLNLLPQPLRTLQNRWEWCWQIAGYLSSAWKYANTADGISYAPWDARTILQWGRAGSDDAGNKAITMCVHYGVAFVQFCLAMGVPARAIVLTPNLNSNSGHFVAEVWLEEFESWAMIDPNLHLYFRELVTDRPLAAAELFERRSELPQLAQLGCGYASQRERMAQFVEKQLLSGATYRLWGIWGRHDWIARRDLAPPAHGAVPYVETDIIWCAWSKKIHNELAMFPHFLSPEQMALSPDAVRDPGTVHQL